MPNNAISDKLNEGVSVIEVAASPTDRELEFAKVTEITESVRGEFLANKEMTIEEAVSKIQEGLTKVALPEPVGELPGAMPAAMPMGMPGGGNAPGGSGDIGSILDIMPKKL